MHTILSGLKPGSDTANFRDKRYTPARLSVDLQSGICETRLWLLDPLATSCGRAGKGAGQRSPWR